MKRSFSLFISALLTLGASLAAAIVDGVAVDRLSLRRDGRYLSVDMALGLDSLEVGSNRAVLLTPRLINGADSLELPSVGIYGRTRYYHYDRNRDRNRAMLAGPDELVWKASDRPDSVAYSRIIPWQEWMNGASLSLTRTEWGCCRKLLATETATLGGYAERREFFPTLVYAQPRVEAVKARALQGSAFIDFPVDRTEIHPDYRRNAVELGKIRATIDSVRADSDITITGVSLKGFASPESPYQHNRELAIGRTDALKAYIQKLYNFTPGVISTDFEAEDWDGLRLFVEQSAIDNRQEILDIIDSDREPDNKEWKIKSTYPEQYRYLLENCYPALRHTDYRISYTIRGYGDLDEIERVLHSQPQKLSLNEFYLLGRSYDPDSEEFAYIFETAARMYPADPTANLNAANAAMRRGDNTSAARFLAKAGDSPEAVYARAALAIRTGDIDAARTLLRQARDLGVTQADETLRDLDDPNHSQTR